MMTSAAIRMNIAAVTFSLPRSVLSAASATAGTASETRAVTPRARRIRCTTETIAQTPRPCGNRGVCWHFLTSGTIAKLRYNALPSDGGEEHCLTSAATFEVGEVMVFGSEGFARVEAVGEKVALGRTAIFVDLYVFDANM